MGGRGSAAVASGGLLVVVVGFGWIFSKMSGGFDGEKISNVFRIYLENGVT